MKLDRKLWLITASTLLAWVLVPSPHLAGRAADFSNTDPGGHHQSSSPIRPSATHLRVAPMHLEVQQLDQLLSDSEERDGTEIRDGRWSYTLIPGILPWVWDRPLSVPLPVLSSYPLRC
jgi:hypothetical protein